VAAGHLMVDGDGDAAGGVRLTGERGGGEACGRTASERFMVRLLLS